MDIQDEITIPLIKPVTIGKGEGAIEYAELKLREPLAGEIEKAQRSDTNAGVVITLIHLIAKVPRGAAERLCQRDMSACEAFLGSFTGSGQPTAEDGQS